MPAPERRERAGGLEAQARYPLRGVRSTTNDSKMILSLILILLLSRIWGNSSSAAPEVSFRAEHPRKPRAQHGLELPDARCSACGSRREARVCAPHAHKAEATPQSREHRLAQVPRGTRMAIRAETSWAACHAHALMVELATVWRAASRTRQERR